MSDHPQSPSELAAGAFLLGSALDDVFVTPDAAPPSPPLSTVHFPTETRNGCAPDTECKSPSTTSAWRSQNPAQSLTSEGQNHPVGMSNVQAASQAPGEARLDRRSAERGGRPTAGGGSMGGIAGAFAAEAAAARGSDCGVASEERVSTGLIRSLAFPNLTIVGTRADMLNHDTTLTGRIARRHEGELLAALAEMWTSTGAQRVIGRGEVRYRIEAFRASQGAYRAAWKRLVAAKNPSIKEVA